MKIRTSVITTTLAAFAAASPLSTSTDGAQNEHSLETRGEKTVMKITLCNNCIGGGRISCNLGHYAYWTHGVSKEGTCDDHSSAFTDSCSAGRKGIDTPFGKGDWHPEDNCDSGASVGTLQGYIQGFADGGGIFKLFCYKANT